jgi:hypothetical protein
MNHYLLLNQSGRSVLYLDKLDGDQQEEPQGDMAYKRNKTIPSYVSPMILESADMVYGANAIYCFLHKCPDLILSSDNPQKPSIGSPFKIHSTTTNSPRSVTDFLSS